MIDLKQQRVYFSTFTIDRWIPLFGDFEYCIQFVIETFNYYVSKEFLEIYAFVVMKDHLHVIWDLNRIEINNLEHAFKSYTSKRFKKYLENEESIYLDNFRSERKDRALKFWKLKSKSIHLIHPDIIRNKIEYIHNNPTKGEYYLVDNPEEYKFSSALSYQDGKPHFPFLTLFQFRN